MKIVVIYDSFFGNTKQIAQTIGNALNENNEVEVLDVSMVLHNQISSIDILIVGSPTRGFRPSENSINFLKSIAKTGLKGVKVAAFDTRLSLPKIKSKSIRFIVKTGGYAAKHIAKALQKKGGISVLLPEGFLVAGEEGPLVEGELERASNWAKSMIEKSL